MTAKLQNSSDSSKSFDPQIERKAKKLIKKALDAKLEADKRLKFEPEISKLTVSETIATDFLKKDRIAAFRFYLLIRNDFSGKFHLSKIAKATELTGHCPAYCKRMLNQLCWMGYLEKKPCGWYFAVGTKRFNVANGYLHPRMARVPQKALESVKHLRTFSYAILISKAAKHANRQPQRFDDLSAGQVTKGVSISYLSKYLGVSTFTACKHRKRANDFELIKVRQQFLELAEGRAKDIKEWREHCPIFYKCVVKRHCPRVYKLWERLPSKIEFGVFSKKRKIHYSKEEKLLIVGRYSHVLTPVLSKGNQRAATLCNK